MGIDAATHFIAEWQGKVEKFRKKATEKDKEKQVGPLRPFPPKPQGCHRFGVGGLVLLDTAWARSMNIACRADPLSHPPNIPNDLVGVEISKLHVYSYMARNFDNLKISSTRNAPLTHVFHGKAAL